MEIKIKKLTVYIFSKNKWDSWKLFILLGIDYDWRAFEIRPFQWALGTNKSIYGHHVFGPFHAWTD